MKRELFVIIALAGAAAVCGSVMTVALSEDQPHVAATKLNAASATTENHYTQSEEGARLGGNAVYIVDEKNYFSGGRAAMYFFNDKGNGWAGPLTNIGNNEDSHPVYAGISPANAGGEDWTTMIVVKLNPTGAVSFDNKMAQSGNLPISGTNNVVYVGNDWGSDVFTVSNFAPEKRMRIFAWDYGWSQPQGNEYATKKYCSWSGELSAEDKISLTSEWGDSKTEFEEELGADVQYAFSHVTAVPDADDPGDEIVQPTMAGTAARYAVIFRRYSDELGLTNWADRTVPAAD